MVPWYLKICGPALNASQYGFLEQVYEVGLLPIGLWKAWHDHSFGGVYPERIWYDLVKFAPELIIDTELYSLRGAVRDRVEGQCVYDAKNGFLVSDSGLPKRIRSDAVAGGVILMPSGGGKTHFVQAQKDCEGFRFRDLIDGDSLVNFPDGWTRDAKLRKVVMNQYKENVLNSALAGKVVFVSMSDARILDTWIRADVVIGYVPVTTQLLKDRNRQGLLRQDQVGRIRHLNDTLSTWQRRGLKDFARLDDAVLACSARRSAPRSSLLTSLSRLLRRNQYTLAEHSWMGKRIWPSTSRMLEEREQISVAQAIALLQHSISHFETNFNDAERLLGLLVGLGGAMASNVIMWGCGLVGGVKELLRLHDTFGFFNGDLRQFMEVTKIFHNLIRNSDSVSWFNGIYSPDHYMYFHLLPGRFSFAHLDFRTELESRMQQARPINDAAYGCDPGTFETLVENVVDYLSHLFAEGSVAKAKESLESFCADFLTWSTSGSAPSRGLALVRDDGTEVRTSGGAKSANLNYMGVAGILDCLGHTPNCIGQPTYKYEAGKLRMLLPGPMYHWVVESMALWGGEGHVLRNVPEIALEQSSFVEFSQLTQRLASTGMEVARACSDYADYNILHTFKRMQMLWNSHADALGVRRTLPVVTEITSTDDMIDYVRRACRWAAAALGDVQSKIDDNTYVKLVRGLWSGWRSTMYINVTFNYAYTTAQRLMFIKKYNVDPLSRFNVLGDDMEGDSPSLWTALRFVSLIDPLGLDAQASKQMVSIRRAEFLRLMYRDGKTISGSFIRGIVGLTSGDTQTGPRYAGIKSAQNISEGLNRLIRRGGDMDRIEAMRLILVKHWSTVKLGDQLYRPTADVLHSPTWLGGMGITRFDGKDARFVEVTKKRTRAPRVSQKDSKLSKMLVSAGWAKTKHWIVGPTPDYQSVDATILTSILPPDERRKMAEFEKHDTITYYKQRGSKLRLQIEPTLVLEFNRLIDQTIKNPMRVPQETLHPNDWWKGLVRDALGPLASHPKAERFLGDTGPQKLNNVLQVASHRVWSARSKLLSLDSMTQLQTVTGHLDTPNPLAGGCSPLLRHLLSLLHSSIVTWLCSNHFTSIVKWRSALRNALHTFEMVFLKRQADLCEIYRV